MKTVIAKLKLPADASEPDVLAAVEKILNRSTELENAQITADLATYKDRIPSGQEEFVKNMLVTNRAGTIAYLDKLPKLPGKTAPDRLHNRGDAGTKPMDTDAAGKTDADRAGEIEAEIQTIRNRDSKITYSKARDQVRRIKPELFGLPARAA